MRDGSRDQAGTEPVRAGRPALTALARPATVPPAADPELVRLGGHALWRIDHQLLCYWATVYELEPAALLELLLRWSQAEGRPATTLIRDGRLRSVVWDVARLPLHLINPWLWSCDLAIRELTVVDPFSDALCGPEVRLPTALPASLRMLSCSGLRLSRINLASAPGLRVLNCRANRLTTLDVRRARELLALDCGENRIEWLELAAVPKLRVLRCGENALRWLEIGRSVPRLEWLDCRHNALRELDLPGVPALRLLNCRVNALRRLPLAAVPELRHLDCGWNPLEVLDLRGVPHLEELICVEVRLPEIDLRPVPKLRRITVSAGVRLIGAPAGCRIDVK
jgi:hypothetical protein